MTLKEFASPKTNTKTTVLSIVLFLFFALLAVGSAPSSKTINPNRAEAEAFSHAQTNIRRPFDAAGTRIRFLGSHKDSGRVRNLGNGQYEVRITYEIDFGRGGWSRSEQIIIIQMNSDNTSRVLERR